MLLLLPKLNSSLCKQLPFILLMEIIGLDYGNEIISWNYFLKLFPEIISWNFCLKLFPEIISWNYFLKLFPEIISWNYFLKSFPEIISWNYFLKLFPEIISSNYFLKFSSAPSMCLSIFFLVSPSNQISDYWLIM